MEGQGTEETVDRRLRTGDGIMNSELRTQKVNIINFVDPSCHLGGKMGFGYVAGIPGHPSRSIAERVTAISPR
jgi:hypothetical protein